MSPTPAAGTTARMDGDVLRFTVRMDIVVDDPSDPENVEGAQVLEEVLETFWNDAFAALRSECLSLALDVDIALAPTSAVSVVHGDRRWPLGDGIPVPAWVAEELEGRRDGLIPHLPVPDGASLMTTPGRHVIYVVEPGYSETLTFDPYAGGSALPGVDYDGPLRYEQWGVWEGDLDERGFAHEFAHLLGLGDDYDPEDGNPLPGREGTVMTGRTGGGTEVDRNILDRLAELARRAGVSVPSCEGETDGRIALPPWLCPRGDCTPRETTIYITGLTLDMSTGEAVCERRVIVCGDVLVTEVHYNTRAATCPFVDGGRTAIATSQTGPAVCCESWWEAEDSKQPCDPLADADCDGIPNDDDLHPLTPGEPPP